ncbi:phosphatase [Nostoc minutum NIES-26]|uniref:Phosphatase n=1 Tax=Nostoc minutum NIES-26 TaxID=1844469 RepID=A0A367R0B1_9NOSO|nr:phosphatase [Nostoc minutum NIES-26]
MSLSRRKFFALAGASAAGTFMVSPLEALYARKANGKSVFGRGYGPLLPDPNGLLDLPEGFQYRAFSRTGELMDDGTLVPGAHDGMAAFPVPKNYPDLKGRDRKNSVLLVRNHELGTGSTGSRVQGPNPYDPIAKGGTTTLLVDLDDEPQLIKHFTSLSGTIRNCAGGPTPWDSWISCEEDTTRPSATNGVTKLHGYNFEVPSSDTSAVDPVALVAMGRFNHEAVAVDPKTGIVYQTEDRGDSLFYRFIPNVPGKLAEGGILQALRIIDRPGVNTSNALNNPIKFNVGQKFRVDWVTITEPNPTTGDTVRVEGYKLGAAQFIRGEGIYYTKENGKSEFYFCATSGGPVGGGQVWRYTPGQETIELFVESQSKDELDMPDNLVVAPFDDLILCEDGDGDNFLIGITPSGEVYKFARNALQSGEFAGATFSPDGTVLFVNIQSPGITLAIWGPWKKSRRNDDD